MTDLSNKTVPPEPQKENMPDERTGKTRKVIIGGCEIYLTPNTYPDGRLGECFIKIGKEGEEDNIYQMTMIAMSIGLQHGIPLSAYYDKFSHVRMDPGGPTSDPEIPMCSSIMDYIIRRLDLDFGDEKIAGHE